MFIPLVIQHNKLMFIAHRILVDHKPDIIKRTMNFMEGSQERRITMLCNRQNYLMLILTFSVYVNCPVENRSRALAGL